MHSCLGLNLAHLEAQVWLERLLVELPEYEMAGFVDYGTNFLNHKPISVSLSGAAGQEVDDA